MFKWNPSAHELRSFVFVMLIGFGFLGGGAFWSGHTELSFWLWSVAGILGILVWVMPRAVLPFYWAWMGLADGMGAVSTRFILFLIFYLILTPVAFFFRFRGRDTLLLKGGRGSYWIDHPPIDVRTDSKHIF